MTSMVRGRGACCGAPNFGIRTGVGAWGGASRSLEPGLTGLPNSRSYTGLRAIGDPGRPLRVSVARGGLRNSSADPGCPTYANPGSALEPVQFCRAARPLWTPPAFAACCIGLPRWQLVTVWEPSMAGFRPDAHTKSNGYSVAKPPFLLKQGFTV